MPGRYDRQLGLAGLGEPGQARLRTASCLVVGAGGLGSPVLLYLAGAGLGRLGILDDDLVEESNLHRQVVHGTPAVGRGKAESAAARVRELNPDVDAVPLAERLDAGSATRLLAGWDLVVDGSDNFPTRYATNAAAVAAGLPLVWGAVQELGGQVGVVVPGEGPCYRCLFPEPPPPGAVPSCAEAGVLGSVPGTLGAVMATEALKLLTGLGRPVEGVLVHDATDQSWGRVPLRRRPECAACGDGAATAGSGVPAGADEAVGPAGIAVAELPADCLLVDVRETDELAGGTLPGAVHLPLSALRAGSPVPEQLRAAAPRPVVAYCASGVRSAEALLLLRRAGLAGAGHLTGGVRAWRRAGRPLVPWQAGTGRP